MSYDEADAYYDDQAYDEYIAELLKEFREEHGEEIAENVAAQEIVVEVVAAHRTWWPKTQASLARARARLDDGSYEEALFHVGRAFDGYVQKALVDPLLNVLTGRFERALPANLPVRAKALFRSVYGLGSTLTFSAYAVAIISRTPEIAETIIGSFRAFVSPKGDKKPIWDARNAAFHSPTDVAEATAREMIDRAEAILATIVAEAERHSHQEEVARERMEFSPARVETLAFLAALYDADPDYTIEDNRIAMAIPSIAGRERRAALTSLEQQNYVARIGDDEEWLSSARFRLTAEGRRYFEESVATNRISKESKARASINAELIVGGPDDP